ncbi:heme-binding protein [Sphingomonas sp. AOB5]|uniref:GlcG/HbpS family heme-binding protein n=1 Tax=Sphingomonas sp. AOB5 TaxID=3034017 RepID=UPI0023F6901C|nr:heme-binding protein [Sphingomonas sp. AOB5]MDF7776397.1 heme-binding protein [Sphingomonas sp. AOB5]
MSGLDHRIAMDICAATLAEAGRRGFAPLCAVVLDAGGHPLALLRDSRASIGRSDIAGAKAAGCLAMGFGGRELARRASAMPGFLAALTGVLERGIVPVPGGVLIRDAAGVLLGALGVSGDSSDNDEICAIGAILAAGLKADTGA